MRGPPRRSTIPAALTERPHASVHNSCPSDLGCPVAAGSDAAIPVSTHTGSHNAPRRQGVFRSKPCAAPAHAPSRIQVAATLLRVGQRLCNDCIAPCDQGPTAPRRAAQLWRQAAPTQLMVRSARDGEIPAAVDATQAGAPTQRGLCVRVRQVRRLRHRAGAPSHDQGPARAPV